MIDESKRCDVRLYAPHCVHKPELSLSASYDIVMALWPACDRFTRHTIAGMS